VIEVLAVVAIIVGLIVIAAVPAGSGIVVGGGVALGSLVLGAIAGLVYHVTLYRALEPRDGLPRGWVWHPTDFHPKLEDAERLRVLPWFWTGASFAALSIFGCLMVVTSVIRSFA
jgi:hypothetical protein